MKEVKDRKDMPTSGYISCPEVKTNIDGELGTITFYTSADPMKVEIAEIKNELAEIKETLKEIKGMVTERDDKR